jgi:hypothetical protein
MSEKIITLTAVLWESEAGDLKQGLAERTRLIDIDLNLVLDGGEWAIGDLVTRKDGKACIILELAEPDEKRWTEELASGGGLRRSGPASLIKDYVQDQYRRQARPGRIEPDARDHPIRPRLHQLYPRSHRQGQHAVYPQQLASAILHDQGPVRHLRGRKVPGGRIHVVSTHGPRCSHSRRRLCPCNTR